MDTVSFNDRHNEANGEDGADGHDNNISDNMGCEGPSEDEGLNAARARRRRAMVATLMISQGVPMLLSGDDRQQPAGQQRLLPGQRHGVDRLGSGGRGVPGFLQPHDRIAPPVPRAGAGELPSRQDRR
ncbi:hypothetical protein ACFSHP_20745 [Novosphingobium panipatense]